ncbi:MAG: hypothetical protein IJP61_07320 [Treponema sp.]|nr:hypothetical protein [Treponema sp.]
MTEQEAKTLVEQHRKAGDLIDFLLKARDESLKNFEMLMEHWTEEEQKEYDDKFEPHITALVEEHKKTGDFDSWFQELKINDIPRCNYIRRTFLQKELKEKYTKEVSEHREKGDLIDFIWEEIEKENFCWAAIYSPSCLLDSKIDYLGSATRDMGAGSEAFIINAQVEENIRFLLTKNEQNEIHNIYSTIYSGGISSDIDKYLYKLSKMKHDTFEYKRYKRICERVDASKRERIEKCIKSEKLKRIILISLSAVVLLLVAGITVKCAVGKDSKDAHRNDEKQRVEKYESKSGLKKIE